MTGRYRHDGWACPGLLFTVRRQRNEPNSRGRSRDSECYWTGNEQQLTPHLLLIICSETSSEQHYDSCQCSIVIGAIIYIFIHRWRRRKHARKQTTRNTEKKQMHIPLLTMSNFTQQIMKLSAVDRGSIHFDIQGGSKSNLLIFSEYVNKTEKIGGMWTKKNSYRENEVLSDIFSWNILWHNCLSLNIPWLKAINEITARQTRTDYVNITS